MAEPSAQYQSSATLAQRLQDRLDAGANVDELLKIAAESGVTLDRAQVQRMVDYGKGARFVPNEQLNPLIPEPPISPELPAPPPNLAETTPVGGFIAGAADVFAAEPSLGLDPALRRELERLGPVGRYLYAPAGDIGAFAGTTIQAGLMGAARGTGQFLENIGVLPAVEALTSVKQTPERFAEQALGVADFAAMKFPFATVPQLSTRTVPVPTAPRIAEVAAEVTPPPMPRVRAPKTPEIAPQNIPDTTPPVIPSVATIKQEGPTSLEQFAQIGQTEDILKLPAHKRVSGFQADVGAELDSLGITRATERGGKPYPFQEFIADHLNAGTLPNEVVAGLIRKHGLFDEKDLRTALGASMESATRAARILNLNSQASRTVLRLVEQNPELNISLNSANRAANSLNAIGSFLRYVGRTRAGLLTGTLGTAARNAWSASPIMPTYAMLTEVADATIRNARNIGRMRAGEELLPGPGVVDSMYSYMDELSRGLQLAARGVTGGKVGVTAAQRRSDNLLKAVQEAFPKQHSDLFATYSSDLIREYRDPRSITGKVTRGLDRFIEFANVGNQLVSRWTKNAQFPAILRMEAKRNGVDLDALFDSGQVSTLDPAIVEDAVRLMQKRLFDERPRQGTVGEALVKVMEHSTQPLGITPFPNFAVSYFKYVAEQNPLAVVRFASKAERQKIANGDHRAVAKIMAGLATTLAFYAAGSDEGEWYEIKDPASGKMIDARATLSPYVPNMFAAHVIRKALQDDLASIRFDDALKVIGASNLRAGAGAYAVDSLVADLSGAGGSENGVRKALDNWAKEYVPGFFRFFSQFKDLSGQVFEEDRLRRMPETTGQAVMSQLPGGAALYEQVTGQAIPESQSITRAATPQTVNPALRTLVGITVPEDQNFLEQTIGRSGLRASDLYRNTGVADFDKLMREKLGEAADAYILPSMEAKRAEIEKLSGPKLRLKLKDIYERNRAAVRKEIYTEDPRLKLMIKFDALSEDERKLENDKALREKGKTVVDMFRESRGKPLVWTDADIEKLPAGTEYMDIRDYKLKVKK